MLGDPAQREFRLRPQGSSQDIGIPRSAAEGRYVTLSAMNEIVPIPVPGQTGAHWISHCWLTLLESQVKITTSTRPVLVMAWRSRHLPLGGLMIWPEAA